MDRFDQETQKYLSVTVHFLNKFFSHSEQASEKFVQDFFNTHKQYDEDDIFYYHPYQWAVMIHFVMAESEKLSEVYEKRVISGEFKEIPDKAIEIFVGKFYD